MRERVGGEAKQELYRRRREEAIRRLVAEAKTGVEPDALEEPDETGASPYREAERLARELHRSR